MRARFVIVDHGLDSGIYKIFAQQTARLLNEFGEENIEIFDSLEDAKGAAFAIVKRYADEAAQSQWQFSFRPDSRVENLGALLSDLSADRVQTFFV